MAKKPSDKIPSGSKLDALIAEKVFGWKERPQVRLSVRSRIKPDGLLVVHSRESDAPVDLRHGFGANLLGKREKHSGMKLFTKDFDYAVWSI